MFEVSIHDQQQLLVIPESLISHALELTFKSQRVQGCHINVILMDNPQIHEFNRKFLNHDEPTDAITFTLHELQEPLLYTEGEILISTEMAIECASEYAWTPLEEALFYIIHGGLHLCGYEDCDQSSRDHMHELQYQILKQIDLKKFLYQGSLLS